MDLNQALPTDVVIIWYVGTEAHRFTDATVDETEHIYEFFADGDPEDLEWSAGETVSMTLTVSIADATLSALAIEGATNGESITLSPAFQNNTFTYRAAVPNEIDAVTLTATTNDSDATAAITGDDNSSTPDTADLDLDVGTNTLTVTVTAEDGSTQTYTITVTRTGVLQAPATVPPDWNLSPFTQDEDKGRGEQFRLIFLSSHARNAQSANISDYNTWIQGQTAAGDADIQGFSDGFTVVGCTAVVDARDNTKTTGTGVPIYWLNGSKVADNYADFYNGDWDHEGNSNDRNELGVNGTDTANDSNFPWTGCENDGTEASATNGTSEALGAPDEYVRLGRPNSLGNGPLSSDETEESTDQRPTYGLSQVFQIVPGNTGTLTTGGTPRSDTLDSSDTGHYLAGKAAPEREIQDRRQGQRVQPVRRHHHEPPNTGHRWQSRHPDPEQQLLRRVPDNDNHGGHRWRGRTQLPPGHKGHRRDQVLLPARPPRHRR